MNCKELVDLLIDFVADELPADQCERISQHLNKCPPCVVYLETYRLTIQMTRKLPCQPLPPQLVERLRQALKEIGCKRRGTDA
jgi:hypothetical protein